MCMCLSSNELDIEMRNGKATTGCWTVCFNHMLRPGSHRQGTCELRTMATHPPSKEVLSFSIQLSVYGAPLTSGAPYLVLEM